VVEVAPVKVEAGLVTQTVKGIKKRQRVRAARHGGDDAGALFQASAFQPEEQLAFEMSNRIAV
jgi:hypothetical protein